MPRVTLTDRFAAGVKQPSGQADYFDSKSTGLVLRVSESGVKSWCLFYTSPRDGKRARVMLGRYPQTTLADARTHAIEAKAHVDQGIDPRDVATGAMTVRQLVESHVAKHVRPSLRSAKAIERRFAKNVLPVIGGLALSDMHRRDINRVLDHLVARGCSTEVVRVFQDMRALFRWAVARGDMDRSPMDGMRMPTPPRPRERVLTDAEIAKLWNALPETLRKSTACQRIIKLCLLTAQRVGEVAGMRTGEIDIEARSWTLPAARSKNKHAHTVPLSDAAILVIKEALVDAADDRLFPDDTGKGGLGADAVGKTIRVAQDRFGIAHWTAHDLRRSAVTGMARLGVSPIVLGHIINHRSVTKAGVTLAVYSQYTYDKEKRQALGLWADRLQAIVRPDTAAVLPLRGKR
jgi:integrase